MIVGNPEEERECTELRGKALTWARLIFLYYTPDGSRPPTYVLTNGKIGFMEYLVKLAYAIQSNLILSGWFDEADAVVCLP